MARPRRSVEGATVREVLDACSRATASCASASPTSEGSLRRFVNVYIAGEDIRFLDGLGDARGRRRRADDPAGGGRRLLGDALRRRGPSRRPVRCETSAASLH